MKNTDKFTKLIIKNIDRTQNNFKKLKKIKNVKLIEEASILIINALKRGNKIMFCGNGGSAADAQHLSAELVGKYLKIRNPLAALCLTTNTSSITSISNDINFSEIFSRQVEAFGKKGDILFGITTSGKSTNIIRACKVAKKKGINTVLLTSTKAGKMSNMIDLMIPVPERRVDRIQEMHITIGHIICEIVENNFS